MMKETGQESQLPKGYRWSDLESKEGVAGLSHAFMNKCIPKVASAGR